MAIKKIDKQDWQSYFDKFSKSFLKDEQPEYVAIQILSDESGVHQGTTWLLMEGITYDSRADLLNIKVEYLDHMILHPTEIFVDEDVSGWITSMEIIEEDGTKEIIEIR